MAKELPFFKFEPSEWLEGNIQICTDEAIVCFMNLLAGYWLKLGDMTEAFALHKYCRKSTIILNELVENDIIQINDSMVSIKFLDEQLTEVKTISSKRSQAAKSRWNKEKDASALQVQNKSNAIRKEKIRIDKKKEDKIISIEERKAEFKNSLLPYLEEYGKEMLSDFFNYWTEHNPNGKKMKFEMQKTFAIKNRLVTWNKKSNQYDTRNHGAGKSSPVNQKTTKADSLSNW